jgi:hypothetical protein
MQGTAQGSEDGVCQVCQSISAGTGTQVQGAE